MNTNLERVVVTGGSGFIGTNLVQGLLDDQIAVINLDLARPRNTSHLSCWRKCDLLDLTTLKSELSAFEPSIIYHLGARTDLLSDRLSEYSANTVGVTNLIRACEHLGGMLRVIFASSRLVCRIGYTPKSDTDYCPTNAYGESKVLGEAIVRGSTLGRYTWTLVRPTSIWGPWFDVPYRTFFDLISTNRYFHPTGVKVLKSFGFVGNTVAQLRRVASAPVELVASKTFYLGDYEPIDVLEFANCIAHSVGAKRIRTLPITLLNLIARIGDQLKRFGYKQPPLTTFRLENLCTNMLFDFGELPKITGPLPYSYINGVAITADWMKSHSRTV